MMDIFYGLEGILARFEPAIPGLAGVVCLLCGLCFWLGGRNWLRTTAFFMGAIGSGLIMLFVGTSTATTAILLMVLAGSVAAVVYKVTVPLAGVVFAICAAAFFIMASGQSPPAKMLSDADSGTASVITAGEGISAIKYQFKSLFALMTESLGNSGPRQTAVAAGIVIISVLAVFLLRPAALAVTTSTFGTLLIFAGMILLLLYKGARPVAYISERLQYYGIVFGIMVIFGALSGLLLCGETGKKTAAEKSSSKGER